MPDHALLHPQIFSQNISPDMGSDYVWPGAESLQSFIIRLDKSLVCRVYQRPHLQQFLEKYCDRFQFDVFTAAARIYADRVLDGVDPNRRYFHERYYRSDCVTVWHQVLFKNLETCLKGKASQCMDRIVLVDDNKKYMMLQPANSILVPKMYLSQAAEDKLFAKTLPDILEKLDHVHDVREWIECHYADRLSSMRGDLSLYHGEEMQQMIKSCWARCNPGSGDAAVAAANAATAAVTRNPNCL